MYTLKYRLKLYFINLKTNFIPKTFIYDCLQLGQNYKLVDENKIFSILAFRDQKYEGYLCCQGLPQQPGDDPPKSSFLSIWTNKLRSLLQHKGESKMHNTQRHTHSVWEAEKLLNINNKNIMTSNLCLQRKNSRGYCIKKKYLKGYHEERIIRTGRSSWKLNIVVKFLTRVSNDTHIMFPFGTRWEGHAGILFFIKSPSSLTDFFNHVCG